MEIQIPTVTVGDLRQFHAKHFPTAPLPEQYLNGVNDEAPEEYYDEDDDGLGYYDDGAKRTLTDDQIAMFRHSEIQRILLERRRRQEAGEPIHGTPTPELAMEDAPPLVPDSMRAASPPSDQSTPMSISSDDDQDKSTPAERPQQKWATTSDKTRARNAKNRKKNRKNHRERKKAERKRIEQEEKDARRRAERGDALEEEESDEWDPWHQANGPDAQKDDAVDLDY